MNRNPFLFAISFLLLSLGLSSCEYFPNPFDPNDPDPIICTEEFRTITIEVKGGELDDYYTFRPSTGEIIEAYGEPFENFYPVLDDSYQPELAGKEDIFEFVGIQKDKEVLRVEIKIKADECHIDKVSGPDSVTL